MIDTQTMLTLNDLNITDSNGPEGLPERPANFVGPYCPKHVLKWPRCLCTTESDWEDKCQCPELACLIQMTVTKT